MFYKYLLAQLVLFGQENTDSQKNIKRQTKCIDSEIIINQLIPRSSLLYIPKHPNLTKNQIKQENREYEIERDKQAHFQSKPIKNQEPIDQQENQPLQILIRQKQRQELFDDQFYGMSIENHVHALQFANSRSKSSEPDASQAVAIAEFNPVFLSQILKSKSQDSNEQQQDIPLEQIEQLQMQPV